MKKTVFITGATSGIGEACAHIFGKNGFRLIITGRRNDRLQKLATLLRDSGSEVLTLNFDVQQYSACEVAFEQLPSEWKTIDVLINNAGLASGLDPIQNGKIDDWEKMIDTNIKGLLYVSRLISPLMVERKSGHIINIGSVAGKLAYPNGNVYSATKFAVNSLTQGMRIDLVKHGIRVSQVSPGMVETEFSVVRFHGDEERAKQAYSWLKPLTGEDIAEAVWWMADRPPHVNINDIWIMPTAQASPAYTERNT